MTSTIPAKARKQAAITANIEMIITIVDEIADRLNTATLDISQDENYNAAVGGLLGLDKILESANACYAAMVAAHRFGG